MKRILTGLLTSIIAGIMLVAPTFAAELTCETVAQKNGSSSCVATNVLGDKYDANGKKEGSSGYTESGKHVTCSCDDGEGSGITHILNLVVEVMTIGVGILGVLGITIVGIQYLTAGGNEEQTRKAKRRMFEIVIGIVAYVVVYALLNWLIPGFDPF